MTWNPLKKTYLTTRPTSSYPALKQEDDAELDKLFRQLQSIEETNRRLQKDMKRYLEAISSAEKAELKLTSDLSSSTMCHENSSLRKLVEDYHSVIAQKNDGAAELMRVTQRTFLDPLKKFGAEFSGLASAFHSHDQLVQDWKITASRLKKLEDRGDRMPNTIVKIERERHILIASAEAINLSYSKLLEELPVFFSKRIDYIQPSLQAVVRAQLDYHGNTTRCFTFLVPSSSSLQVNRTEKNGDNENISRQQSPSALPDAQFQSFVQSKLGGIRELSIVNA